MRIQIAVPEAHVTKPVLDGALEAVTRLNEQMIKDGSSPTADQLIARGAIWKPEPPGQEHFDHGALIAKRGEGDCDDWAPLKAAQLRVTGVDPGARAVVKKSGEKRWHAIVQRSDGSIDDPSLDAGMPGPARALGVSGSWVPPMESRMHGVSGTFIAQPKLALRPIADRAGQVEAWQARADLPWHWKPGNSPADLAMVSLHMSPVSDQAVVGALRGAIRLGCVSGADAENLKRLSAIADACEGCDYEELAHIYGREHANAASQIVSGFFGKAFKKLGKIAKGAGKFITKNPLAKMATSIIPGAGLATAAFNAASPAFRKSVAKQSHVPAPQRQPMIISPQSRVSPSPMMRPAPAPAPAAPRSSGPIIVQPRDPNVTLLTNFGGMLQRAYEFSGSRGAVAPRPTPARPRAAAPRATPGVAWPPRR